jgi:hypothetical protein
MQRAAALLALLPPLARASPSFCGAARVAACQACNGYLAPSSCQCKCEETPAQTVLYTVVLSFVVLVVFVA